MKDRTILGLAAIVAVTVVELYALYRNMDGAILTAVVAALAALGGAMLQPQKLKNVAPAVIGFTLELDSQTIAILGFLIVAFALVYIGYRMVRIPRDLAEGFADSMAELAKETSPDPEAFAHLQQSISEAVRTRSWEPLVGLIGNPIAIKALGNLKGLASKVTSQTTQTAAAGD